MPDFSGIEQAGSSISKAIMLKGKQKKEDEALKTLTGELSRSMGDDSYKKSGVENLIAATAGMDDRFQKLADFINIRKSLTATPDETPDSKQKRELNTDLIKRGQAPVDASDPDFTNKAAAAFAAPNNADKKSADERKQEGKASVVMSSIDSIKRMINDPKSRVGLDRNTGVRDSVGAYLNQARVDSNTPAFVANDTTLNELQGYVGALRSNTLFGQAGSALTETERNVIEPLINISGKTTERINQDLDAFRQQWTAMIPGIQQRLASKGTQLKPEEANPFGEAAGAAAQVNAPQGGIQEGATATNPKTGAKILYKGGQWQPTK